MTEEGEISCEEDFLCVSVRGGCCRNKRFIAFLRKDNWAKSCYPLAAAVEGARREGPPVSPAGTGCLWGGPVCSVPLDGLGERLSRWGLFVSSPAEG